MDRACQLIDNCQLDLRHRLNFWVGQPAHVKASSACQGAVHAVLPHLQLHLASPRSGGLNLCAVRLKSIVTITCSCGILLQQVTAAAAAATGAEATTGIAENEGTQQQGKQAGAAAHPAHPGRPRNISGVGTACKTQGLNNGSTESASRQHAL